MRIHVTMLLLVIAFFPVVSGKTCETGWKLIGSKCYRVFYQKQCEDSWGRTHCDLNDFTGKCATDSAKLATVKSTQVANFISKNAQTSSIFIDGGCDGSPAFNGIFRWSDGTVVNGNFAPGKPVVDPGRCCLEMYKATKKFNNIECAYMYYGTGTKRQSYDYACMKNPK